MDVMPKSKSSRKRPAQRVSQRKSSKKSHAWWEGTASIYSTLGGWGPIWQEAFCTTCAFMTGLKGKESALSPGSGRSLPGSKSFTVKEKPLPDSQIWGSPWLQTHRSHTRHTHAWRPRLQKQNISCHAWRGWWRKAFLKTTPFTTPCWTA